MNILQETIRLITRSPGDVVYFLVTLFALQQAFFTAISVHKAAPDDPPGRRWLWAIGGLLGGRVVLILVGLLGIMGEVEAPSILPPLERGINFISLALIIWAGVYGSRARREQTYILLGLILLSLLFCGYSIYSWGEQEVATVPYNGQSLELVWEGLAVISLLGLLGLAAWQRPPEWEWLIGLAAFALLGHGAQILWPDPTVQTSGWLRLASLVIFPLLSLIVYRQLTLTLTPSGSMFVPDAQLLQEVLFSVESAREVESTLILTSSRLARLLDADLCVIAFHPPNDHTRIKVIAIHPPTPAQIDLPELDLMDYPPLAEAYAEHKSRIVPAVAPPLWLEQLYLHLGVEQSGPLVIAPLCHRDDCLGLLLLGNPESGRPWPVQSLPAYDLVTHLLAEAIVHAQKRIAESESLQRQRSRQESELRNLKSAFDGAQQEIESLKKRITVLVNELKIREREIQRLANRLTRPKTPETEISFWQNEVRSLAAKRDELKKKVEELVRDRTMLNGERSRLVNELSETQSRLEASLELRRELEQRLNKLEAQQERLRQQAPFLREVSLGLLVSDREGKIVTADVLAHRILNLPPDNVIGVPLQTLYPSKEWTHTIGELLSTKPGARRRAHLLLSQLGESVAADLVTLLGPQGKPTGLVLTVRAPGGVIEQQQVLVSVVNEFRSPMTAMIGYTDLLLGEQAGALSEMQKQFLHRVKANVEHLGQLLNDLLYLTAPESRPLELRPVPVNLARLVGEAVIGLSAQFRERHLTVRMELPADVPVVSVERGNLLRIISRLLSNAVQCSREGSEIEVRARREGEPSAEVIHVTLRDTCGGIAPGDYARVFHRFYRADQPLIQGLGEKGIGMAMIKTLIESCGGRIWVESELGKGSTFHFTLPL